MAELPSGMKLNVGCGKFPCAGTDWINVDVNPEIEAYCARLDGEYHFRRAEAHQLDFIGDGEIALAYSSHLIEHYSVADGAERSVGALLAEWWRVLAPNAELWIATPDLTICANRVLSETRTRDRWIRIIYGHQLDVNDHHLWLYNKATLGALLVDNGFWPCGQFEPFVRAPDGKGFDCAGAWCHDDWGNQCELSICMKATKRTAIDGVRHTVKYETQEEGAQ